MNSQSFPQPTPVVVSDITHVSGDGEAYELISLRDVQHDLGGEVELTVNGTEYILDVNDLARLVNLAPSDPIPAGYLVHTQSPPDGGFTAVVEQYHLRGTGIHDSWGHTELVAADYWLFCDRTGGRPHLLPTMWYPVPTYITRSGCAVVQYIPIPHSLALT